MSEKIRQWLGTLGRAAAFSLISSAAASQPQHGIAMYGAPALPPDFVSLPYTNPDAPTGGKIVTGEVGSFDSLNPLIDKGRVPWQLRFLAYESLMGRNWDEPFSLYGLLAESVEVGPNREWAEFTLRPEARFSDGSPVTVEDVMWSYETLGTQGHGRYRGLWSKIATMQQTGPRSLRFTFNEDNRELALIVGMRPILKKDQWTALDFKKSGLDVIPISTAPYVIDEFEAGRFISLRRNPDYWGTDVPYMSGQANVDEIRLEFFGTGVTQFEAFKAGILNSNREFNVEKWDSQYNFPAIASGDVVKSVIENRRPSGITGFVMNTRRAPFDDWRVRDALIHAFNFEYINDAITGGRQPRITSYFSNSVLAMQDGPATGRVAEFLTPFADSLLPGTLEGYALPKSDGSLRNRSNLKIALDQLAAAGWTVQNGIMQNAAGDALIINMLLRQGSAEIAAIVALYADTLKRLGIEVRVSSVEGAQYAQRTRGYDFDMAYYRRGLSLSPGNEQRAYWGRDGIDTPGSRNWMGMDSPAAEGMIDRLLTSTNHDDFLAATRALDRVLTSGRYVIPIYQWNISRLAHVKGLRYPEKVPMYGDWIVWQPSVWWYDKD
jgi:peptide/nickel transport system substrate-binding protein